MSSTLWRGSWATRLRIASGLFLFSYVLLHFLNIGMGLFSPEALERVQGWRQVFSRSLPGSILLYGALLIHAGLALSRLAGRRSLRMPMWEATQMVLGLLIPLLLLTHITYTRYAHEQFGLNDDMSFVMVLIWGTASGWKQALLLLIVWVHGCIGLHFWLRFQTWWRRAHPVLIALFALVPMFALSGFLVEGRRMHADFADPDTRQAWMDVFNWPDSDTFDHLLRVSTIANAVMWSLFALVVAIYVGRKLWNQRNTVRVRYVLGPDVSSPKGLTLLEISRAKGIPHTSLCGGRGRCTTCRVIIEDGADLLHPPNPAEARSLKAVNAPPNARLACQIRPTEPLSVFRVFLPDGRRARAHASQGEERKMAILFLDMRGFTARTTGQLPYDVVFLLNRFFDAVVPMVQRAGGRVDKYLGDGFLAIFDMPDAARSACAGLAAARDIGTALDQFNDKLASEGTPPVRIGMGLHLGNLVLGEIGAAGHAPRTIIGDVVNAASRLEGQTKALGVELLVSSDVLDAAGIEIDPARFLTLDLRGVAQPIRALPVARAADTPDGQGTSEPLPNAPESPVLPAASPE